MSVVSRSSVATSSPTRVVAFFFCCISSTATLTVAALAPMVWLLEARPCRGGPPVVASPELGCDNAYERKGGMQAGKMFEQMKEDKEKTAFTTPCGMYFFVRMPFGLKIDSSMLQGS